MQPFQSPARYRAHPSDCRAMLILRAQLDGPAGQLQGQCRVVETHFGRHGVEVREKAQVAC